MLNNDWTNKAAVISEAAIWNEYRVPPDFIWNAIRLRQLDYREKTIKGKRNIRVLRRQLEFLIQRTPEGAAHLATIKAQRELKEVAEEISFYKKRLSLLQTRKAQIEASKGFYC